MANVGLILLCFAFVVACIACKWQPPAWNFVALAIALWIAAELIGGAGRVLGIR